MDMMGVHSPSKSTTEVRPMSVPNSKQYMNFMSYNSTGFNMIKSDWLRNIMKIFDIQFCQLQEHFKKYNYKNFFKNEFPDFKTNVIPAYYNEEQTRGCPSGGLTQMWSHLLDISCNPMKTNNPRLQAQISIFRSALDKCLQCD